jgi:flagellar protein FliL
MATTTAEIPEMDTTPKAQPAAQTKPPMMMLLALMVLTVLLSVGGVAGIVIYLAKSGRLATGGAAGAVSSLAAKAGEAKVATHALVMEPMLVNLVDVDGHSYLRAGVTLRIEDPPKKKGEKEPEAKDGKVAAEVSAPLRDTVLAVLGRQRSEELLMPDGKERLKRELKLALAVHVPESKVTEIYFTDFLVQR